ncbi:hypothetical protein SPLC1_S080360 [Arthrospira platensis C1]|nr:hypothetical protein SPLC1_S080360 [Arthrospira platensis C1]
MRFLKTGKNPRSSGSGGGGSELGGVGALGFLPAVSDEL